MRYFIGIGFILISSFGLAQKNKIDILMDSLNKANLPEEKITIQIELADRMTESDIDKSQLYISQALNQAKQLGNNSLIQDANAILASLYMAENEKEEGKEILKDLLKTADRPSTLSKVHYLLAQSLVQEGKNDSALYHYSRGNDLALANGLDYRLIEGYYNLGMYFWRKKEYTPSDSLFSKALTIAKNNKEFGQLAKLSYTVGSSYVNRGKFQKGIESFQKGYKASKKTIYHDRTVALANQLAIGSYYSNDTAQAYAYWDEGAKLIKKHNITTVASLDLLRDCGILMIEMKNLKGAERILSQLQKITEASSNTIEELGALGHLANIHATNGQINLSNKEIDKVLSKVHEFREDRKIYNAMNGVLPALIKNSRYKEANEILPMFKYIVDTHKGSSNSKNYYKFAYETYKGLGKHKEALAANESYVEIEKNAVSKMNNKRILDVKIKFESEEKELRNKVLEENNKLILANTQKLVLTLLALGFFLIVLTVLYYKNKKANKKIQQQNDRLTAVNATKDRLFAIISHDLRSEVSAFQNLNSILDFHLDKNNYNRLKEIVNQVDKSAISVNSLMDNLLQWSTSQLDGIRMSPQTLNLKDATNSVLKLFEQYSSSKGIELILNFGDNQKVIADENSLQFIIRNVISNAMKYTSEGDKIKIETSESSEGIALKISDTGIGISKDKLDNIWLLDKKSSRQGTHGERGAGIGLSMVKDFVERNHGKIHIESKEDHGTTVTIILPKAS